jgi:hypothetical protein
MEGGLCYFHANPDKAAESVQRRNGGKVCLNPRSTANIADVGQVRRKLDTCECRVKSLKFGLDGWWL